MESNIVVGEINVRDCNVELDLNQESVEDDKAVENSLAARCIVSPDNLYALLDHPADGYLLLCTVTQKARPIQPDSYRRLCQLFAELDAA